MARGIAAFVFIAGLVLAMSMLAGVGYFADVENLELDADSHNEDVVAAADSLNNVSYDEDRSSSILGGPLAAVTPAVSFFLSFVTVISNTSGVLQLLFGLPAAVADPIQTFFRIAMVATLLYLIRSGSPV